MRGPFAGAAISVRRRFERFVIAWVAVATVITAAPAAASPILSIVPSTTTVAVGDVFILEFWLGASDPTAADDVFDLYAYQFGVAFNPLVLSANFVSNGSFLSSGGFGDFFIDGIIDNTAGVISSSGNTLLAAPQGVSGSGSLFSVQFTALATGVSLVSAVFDPANGDGLLDFNFLPIAFSAIPGSVTVAQVPEPATLLSVVVGLAVGAAAARRRRRMRA